MTSEVKEHLFEPFFSTKSAEGGTGLGLANVFEITRSHGGTIGVESTPGRGTTFTIRLPALATSVRPASPRPQTSAPPDVARGSRLRVLLADDEAVMRRSLGRLLRQMGHEVTEAADGREALDALENAPTIDLLILDLDMPVLDGESCFRELRARGYTLPVVFATGHGDLRKRRELEALGVRAVLGKPFSVAALERTLRDVVSELEADLPTGTYEAREF
jgi:two-component system, cell cycle sensor histidine kinase and response regulator CckA